MVTAIGCGIGPEFDIEKLRYHRVIIMTDADVDGSHIRTLLLTFFYRQMQPLVDAGHVFIAVPPLYRIKLGGQDRYIVKEAHFEELLIRERAKDIEVAAREGAPYRVTEQRHQKLTSSLAEFDGWLARFRSEFGSHLASFVVTNRLLELDGDTLEAIEGGLSTLSDDTFSLESAGPIEDGVLRVRLTELETSAATIVSVPVEALTSPTYKGLRKAYDRLVQVAGLPPFGISLGKKSRSAATFDALRTQILDLATDGIQMSRFKGLGEMNSNELWETTMDPDNRVLVQVGVEDAMAADRIFSMLMGDQVEPRRAFIEQNAKYARLDV
jgi:DNA gyrase subunit B